MDGHIFLAKNCERTIDEYTIRFENALIKKLEDTELRSNITRIVKVDKNDVTTALSDIKEQRA